jgi:hypothetical protein
VRERDRINSKKKSECVCVMWERERERINSKNKNECVRDIGRERETRGEERRGEERRGEGEGEREEWNGMCISLFIYS